MKIVPQKVELIDHMGSDISVVNAARVSFAKESNWDYDDDLKVKEGDQKLIRYLASHNHWTPFAHAFLSFRIKAPIFVARQLVKHQVGLSWNEVSRRYVDDEPEFYLPAFWRKRPDGNVKQGSGEDYDEDASDSLSSDAEDLSEKALRLYNDYIKYGVAPEQARMVLPQNTMTEWIWSGSLAAFARVVTLRLDPHAQKETQEVAQMINSLIPGEFEHSWKALVGI